MGILSEPHFIGHEIGQVSKFNRIESNKTKLRVYLWQKERKAIDRVFLSVFCFSFFYESWAFNHLWWHIPNNFIMNNSRMQAQWMLRPIFYSIDLTDWDLCIFMPGNFNENDDILECHPPVKWVSQTFNLMHWCLRLNIFDQMPFKSTNISCHIKLFQTLNNYFARFSLSLSPSTWKTIAILLCFFMHRRIQFRWQSHHHAVTKRKKTVAAVDLKGMYVFHQSLCIYIHRSNKNPKITT